MILHIIIILDDIFFNLDMIPRSISHDLFS